MWFLKRIVYTVVASTVIVCWCKIFSQRYGAGCHVWMTDTNGQLQADVQTVPFFFYRKWFKLFKLMKPFLIENVSIYFN